MTERQLRVGKGSSMSLQYLKEAVASQIGIDTSIKWIQNMNIKQSN